MAGQLYNNLNYSSQIPASQILESGHLNRQQYLQIVSVLLSNQKLADEEKTQLVRLLDQVYARRLKIID